MTIERRCEREIVELHEFFEQWFTGKGSGGAESFARVAGALGDGFVIIFPDGKLVGREALLAGLREGYGRRSNFRIWIKNVRLHHHEGEVAVATYEEWQESTEGITARLSTVVFREKAGNANQLEWRHVHETWLA
ncbi:MAG: DUF4440 domain-containing protein [Ardenticatenaceae bacterium]